MSKICSIDGCGKHVVCRIRGLCNMHYTRWKRHGDPLVLKIRKPKPHGDYAAMVLRFWSKVEVAPPHECWLWKSSARRYGSFHVGTHLPGKRRRPAHQASYMINIGPITPGLHVLHSCDNNLCVNPAHLHLGTHRDNMRECTERHRRNPPRGEENVRSILTESKVLEMRKLREAGAAISILAKQYGVCHNTVRNACTGKSWRHL